MLGTTEAPASRQATGTADRERYRETAHRIGAQLAHDAIRDGDRCNWIGGDPLDLERTTSGPSYSALGPSLYSGTSGVALFLAELYASVGDAAIARTALGAIRQALSRADAVEPSGRPGLHTGWAGIAMSAMRVATILGAADVADRAAALVQRLIDDSDTDTGFDMIAGRAGVILALLAVRSHVPDGPLEAAERLGRELVRSAEWGQADDACCSWRSPAYPKWRNLTGYSHGTAGAAHALLELYAVTHERRFLDTARGAFAYEAYWFDPAARNWPDFRETSRRRRSVHPLSFATFWCHGAPGIALSRIRAHEILGDAAALNEARVALSTTRQAVDDAARAGLGNFSLCHGIAGNAEVLLTGLDVLDDQRAQTSATIARAASWGQHQYDVDSQSWPCGTHAGPTQSLMLGLAGIGRFYLRLHDPALPSMLLIRPAEFGV